MIALSCVVRRAANVSVDALAGGLVCAVVADGAEAPPVAGAPGAARSGPKGPP